jgi:glucose-6-phosphate dehydrogenase assembly protein OpcA
MLARPDGRTATLSWPGRPDRRVALHRRDSADLIAEELRRLEPDEVYGETLHALAGGNGQ